MYRLSPVTYFMDAILSTGVAGVDITCATKELAKFDPPVGESCASYLKEYMSYAGGQLLNPNSKQKCQFCPVKSTDAVLALLGYRYDSRWRDLAITVAYSVINVAAALGMYWLFRVSRTPKRQNH